VRKLRRADELSAAGKSGESIAAELGVSTATQYNWRRTYGGMDTDAAKELNKLREHNGQLKRLLAEALSMSERLACKALGLARSAYRNLPMAQTPNDPDAELRGPAARLRDQTSASSVSAGLGGTALRRAP
jgi:putative transposase